MGKIIVLSDMFGQIDKSNYMGVTAQFFKAMDYEVDSYSSAELGGIKDCSSMENMHQLFLEGGIKNAATTLSSSTIQYDLGIGYSMGGFLLWEACKINPSLLKNLACISSTRLRYETTTIKPVKTTLIYGENDSQSPNLAIINALSDHHSIIRNNGHDLYKKQAVLEEILNNLKLYYLT